MLDLLVLIGTQTGNGELVAEHVAEALNARGVTCHLTDMADAFPETLADFRHLLVVMCTWSEGTAPDNAVDFLGALDDVAPDLAHLAFAQIALGDRDYDPFFLTASLRLDETLKRLGARELLPMHALDGTPNQRHFADAVAWAERLAERHCRDQVINGSIYPICSSNHPVIPNPNTV